MPHLYDSVFVVEDKVEVITLECCPTRDVRNTVFMLLALLPKENHLLLMVLILLCLPAIRHVQQQPLYQAVSPTYFQSFAFVFYSFLTDSVTEFLFAYLLIPPKY